VLAFRTLNCGRAAALYGVAVVRVDSFSLAWSETLRRQKASLGCVCFKMRGIQPQVMQIVHVIPASAVAPPTSSSTYLTRVVTCKLCVMQLPLEDALVISERGFLCPGCSGEVEAALAQKRER